MKSKQLLLLIIVIVTVISCKKDQKVWSNGDKLYLKDYDIYCPISIQPLEVIGLSQYDNPAQAEESGHDYFLQSTIDTSMYYSVWGNQLTKNKEDSNKKNSSTHFHLP